MRISLLLPALALLACGGDDSKAPLSPGGGGEHQVGVDHPDSGRNVDEMDAGSTPDAGEGPVAFECARIEAVTYSSDENPNVTATSAPLDFKVTRQVATWTGDCPSPSITIKLSNGICPNGQGHELEFWFPANAIADGTIGLGLNRVDVEPAFNGIRVRYTRPERYSGEGQYGTCGAVTGNISFLDSPEITRANDLRAQYELNLGACDGKANPNQIVSGVFNVRLRRALSMVCPP
jgi:hypothetical protein